MSFGQALKEWRRRKFLTQKELAARLGVTYQSVQRWEAGLGLPYPATRRKLVEALEVDPAEFLAVLDRAEQELKRAA